MKQRVRIIVNSISSTPYILNENVKEYVQNEDHKD